MNQDLKVVNMDLTFLNQTDYLLDVWSKKVADNPSARMLTDERHPTKCPDRSMHG